MIFELTKHARVVMNERQIPIEWVERTMISPELRLPDPDDPDIERRFLRIPEFEGRVLRVAVNNKVVPELVISVFFDRNMRNKL